VLKFLKNFIIATGIVLVGAAIALMVVSYIQINYIVTTLASAHLDFEWKPLYWVYLGGAAGFALLGAFALGLGFGIPKQTFKQRLKKTDAKAAIPATDQGSN